MLNEFKQNDLAWMTVDKILENAQNPNTKFFGLQMLDDAVNVSLFLLDFVDPLAHSQSGRQARHPQCARKSSALISRRRKNAVSESVPIDQTKRDIDFNRQVRVENWLVEFYS